MSPTNSAGEAVFGAISKLMSPLVMRCSLSAGSECNSDDRLCTQQSFAVLQHGLQILTACYTNTLSIAAGTSDWPFPLSPLLNHHVVIVRGVARVVFGQRCLVCSCTGVHVRIFLEPIDDMALTCMTTVRTQEFPPGLPHSPDAGCLRGLRSLWTSLAASY